VFIYSEYSFNNAPNSFFQNFVATESGVIPNNYYAMQWNVHSDRRHRNDAMYSNKTLLRVRLQEGH